MRIFITLLLVFSFMAYEANAAGNAKYYRDLTNCKGKGCFVVATKLPWAELSKANGVKIKYGLFLLTIPPDIVQVSLGSDVTVFRYTKIPHIALSTETKETFQLTSEEINLSQALDVIFTNTPKDHKLSANYNKELWNNLMLAEMGLLDHAGKAFIYKNGRLTAYYIPDAGEPFKYCMGY